LEVFLETERLVLRRFTDADVDLLFDLDSDPHVMRFLTGGALTPRVVIAHEILPRILGYYSRFEGFGFWAAIEKATGDFLGWFSFRPLDEARGDQIELGYRLRRAAWGRGYATEGSRALIRKGFTELGVQRVVASTFEANTASRRVMEKAGMGLVRTYRITPEELLATETYHISSLDFWDGDDVEYALDRADWAQEEAANPRGDGRAACGG
jgi:RimJ/RimL family protein N-acetyltransferase